MKKNKLPQLSVVVPIFNEEQNVSVLIEETASALKDYDYELILVDDGSTDKSIEIANNIAANQHLPYIRLIEFSRNYGQTSAMAAGIDAAQAPYIVTMDGDLQNDPSDIPAMLRKLEEEGLDIVAGNRANRKDGMMLRKIPSKLANKLIRNMSNVHIQDYGCTLKIFKKDFAKKLDLYGELHRFIPILGNLHGAKIGQMDVKHHPRKFGYSKYGIGRTFKVLSDLMLMFFLIKYRQKPMHLFGSIGMSCFMIGSMIALYLLAEKIQGYDIGGRPLFYVGILLFIMSVQFITTGFVAELVMRTYYGSSDKKPYTIRREFLGGKET